MPGNSGDDEKHGNRKPRSDCTEIVQPFSNGEANQVQEGNQRQGRNGKNKKICFAVRKRLPANRTRIQRVPCREIKNGGIVREIAGPICPASDESRKFSECPLGPNIKSAFLRIS